MFEQKYKNLLLAVLNESELRPTRTKTKAYSLFGQTLSHSIKEGFPILTGKKMYKKNFIHELIWIINGDTNIKYLNSNKVFIWDEWADASGELGPIYGYQLRNFNGKKDQLKNLLHDLKEDPFSRRLLVNLWNPCQINEMALPPCHFGFQLYVSQKKALNINVFMRSCDAFIGLPYDFALYACLLIIIAKEANLEPDKIQINFTDLHVYENHIEGVMQYLNSPTYPLPTMEFDGSIDNLFEENFKLINYKCGKFIKVPIAV